MCPALTTFIISRAQGRPPSFKIPLCSPLRRTCQRRQVGHALRIAVARVQQQEATQVLGPHKARLRHLQLPVAQRELAQLAPLGLVVCAAGELGGVRGG